MSQHIGKLQICSVFILSLFLVDVGVSGGIASKKNAALTRITAQPLLVTTPEPWHFLVTQTPAKEKAKEGETVILNCHFNSPQRPSLTDLRVKWYKEDEKGQMDLIENNVTVLPNNSRVFMSGDLSQGDAFLVILNVTTSDHGIYFCEVRLPDGKVVTGDGTKLRIRRALGLFGLEESIGTIIGVMAAVIGGIVVLLIVLTPQLRKCILCMRQGSHQGHSKILFSLLKKIPEGLKEELLLPLTGALPPPDGLLGGDREELAALAEKSACTLRLMLPTQHRPFANSLNVQSSPLLYLPESLGRVNVL